MNPSPPYRTSSRRLKARHLGLGAMAAWLLAASHAWASPQNTTEWGDPNAIARLPAIERSEDIAAAELVETRLRARALGIKHYTGNGVVKDKVEALAWFRKAADRGDPVSQFIMGALHADGDGVAENKVLAHMWWSLAAAQGNEEAKGRLTALEQIMTPEQLTEAKQRMAAWRPKKR